MDMLLRENAGGNPFFAEEILGYWLEDAHSQARDESSVTAPSVALLPNDVNSLLIARLDRLASPVKRAVVAAAVLGKEFDLRVLKAMLDDPQIDEHVRFAEKQSIWSQRSEVLYQFRNALLRSAAYEMQARARLQHLHLLAAEATLALFGPDADDQLVALARHYRRAGIRDKAQRYFLAAARQATHRYAHDEAKLLYRSYFRLVEGLTPESVIVRYELARDVLEPRGELDEALKMHSQVLSEAQQLGDRGSEALAFLGLGRVHCAARRMEPARTCFGHTMRIARQLGSRWMEGQALVHLALCHKADGRLAATCAAFSQALAVGRQLGQVEGDRSLFGDLALRHQRAGRLEKAINFYEQALSIQPDAG
jgi:predicted ATPase